MSGVLVAAVASEVALVEQLGDVVIQMTVHAAPETETKLLHAGFFGTRLARINRLRDVALVVGAHVLTTSSLLGNGPSLLFECDLFLHHLS